jgi:hypothetical protein
VNPGRTGRTSSGGGSCRPVVVKMPSPECPSVPLRLVAVDHQVYKVYDSTDIQSCRMWILRWLCVHMAIGRQDVVKYLSTPCNPKNRRVTGPELRASEVYASKQMPPSLEIKGARARGLAEGWFQDPGCIWSPSKAR